MVGFGHLSLRVVALIFARAIERSEKMRALKANLVLKLLEARYCLREDYESLGGGIIHPVEAVIRRQRATIAALMVELGEYRRIVEDYQFPAEALN